MYIVRADGNAQIGAGHLMRCMTIAEALVQLIGTADEVLFVCADEASASFARDKGFRAESLGTDYRNMEEELPLWEKLLCHLRNDARAVAEHVILVDSYYVTERYLRELHQYGKLFLLDDMARQSYPVDGIINYNVFAREEKYRQLYGCADVEYCIGEKFVPIRSQFTDVEYEISDSMKEILITTGGGDICNIAGAILKTIFDENWNYHVISGKFNPHREELENFAAVHKNVHIYHDVKDMAGMMRQCDMAVTAGGTTIYELAAIGVPFICFSYAENQEALTNFIGKYKIACYAGAYHKNAQSVLENMASMARELCVNKEQRDRCHIAEKQLIDGKGAERLARILWNREQSK